MHDDTPLFDTALTRLLSWRSPFLKPADSACSAWLGKRRK
jgi:hypothetical protein